MTLKGLLYLGIAEGKEIQCSASKSITNAPDIVALVLTKIDSASASKQTFLYHDYAIHYITSEGLTYLAISGDGISRRAVFGHLMSLKLYAESHAVDQSYLTNIIEGSSNTALDPARQVQDEIDAVKDIMTQNIERVLERGERIEVLVDKSSQLQAHSMQFRKKSREVKRSMWWQKTRTTALFTGVGVMVTYILIGTGCGLPLYDRCL